MKIALLVVAASSVLRINDTAEDALRAKVIECRHNSTFHAARRQSALEGKPGAIPSIGRSASISPGDGTWEPNKGHEDCRAIMESWRTRPGQVDPAKVREWNAIKFSKPPEPPKP